MDVYKLVIVGKRHFKIVFNENTDKSHKKSGIEVGGGGKHIAKRKAPPPNENGEQSR